MPSLFAKYHDKFIENATKNGTIRRSERTVFAKNKANYIIPI